MKELIAQLAPYILIGAGALAGIGGTVEYKRRNGNSNGKYVPRSEFLEAIETIRKEGREDRQIIFRKLDKLSSDVNEFGRQVARIQGAHEKP